MHSVWEQGGGKLKGGGEGEKVGDKKKMKFWEDERKAYIWSQNRGTVVGILSLQKKKGGEQEARKKKHTHMPPQIPLETYPL